MSPLDEMSAAAGPPPIPDPFDPAFAPSQSSERGPISAADSTDSADALNASELSKLGSES
jgi:hypothetical protein